MADGVRTQGVPSITARRNWSGYAVGMLVETVFILFLTAVGYLLAVVGAAIWR